MSAKCFIEKKRRLGVTGCCARASRVAILAAAFAAMTMGVTSRALAQADPPGCTTDRSAAAIFIEPAAGLTTLNHGNEICFQVELFNDGTTTCNTTGLDTRLTLPNGTVVPITVGAALNRGDDYFCPGDSRCVPFCVTPGVPAGCVPSSLSCTLPGGVMGYKYIIAHANEHGETGTSCPPMPAAGIGQLSVDIRSTAGTVHRPINVGASLCKAAAVDINHACCSPCGTTCTDVASASACPAPSTFISDKNCSEVPCTPVVCTNMLDQCNNARCDDTTGLCTVPVPKPFSTVCEADGSLCTPDHCDGAGSCVPNPAIPPVVCTNMLDQCNNAACDRATGLCTVPVPKPFSTPCVTDTNACTTEHCNGAGACVRLSTVCDTLNYCDDGVACTVDTCDINVAGCCTHTTCNVGICRTPGFWGTHARANPDKPNSQNITQAVIDVVGSLFVCGECIDSTTRVNASTPTDADNAIEAICVKPSGAIKLQNARQLTALALNCIVSGFGANCGGDTYLMGLFSDCNTVCSGGAPIGARNDSQCRNEIDCYNNGGRFDAATRMCDFSNPDNCHNRPLDGVGGDFDPPGPAGSEDDCNNAIGNNCTIILQTGNCAAKGAAGENCCVSDNSGRCED